MSIERFKIEFALSHTSLLKKHCKSNDTYNEVKQCINEASDILTFIERDIDEDMKESRVKQEESGEIKPVIHLKVNKGLCPSTVFNDDRKVALKLVMRKSSIQLMA